MSPEYAHTVTLGRMNIRRQAILKDLDAQHDDAESLVRRINHLEAGIRTLIDSIDYVDIKSGLDAESREALEDLKELVYP